MFFVGRGAGALLLCSLENEAEQGFAPCARLRVESRATRVSAYADLSEYAFCRRKGRR